MRLQNVANTFFLGLLSTPGISNRVGRFMLTLYVVGRKSGRRYTLPVAYMEYEGTLMFGTTFNWGKNLRTGEPLEVKYKGKRRTADVRVTDDENGVIELYGVLCRSSSGLAKFNKVRMDEDGNSNTDDLRALWHEGARAVQLTLR
jgi:hypothetical protein